MSDKDEIEYKEKYQKHKIFNANDLKEIKGIGEETIKDISTMFDSKEKLIKALKDNKVALRNDVVKKLKSYFKIDEGDNDGSL